MSGRSFCDRCKKKISWFDNIPLFSYLLLRGKCRSCGQKISLRYPAIELSTGVTFLLVTCFLNKCTPSGALCLWQGRLGPIALPYLLFVASTLIAIFIIDLEHQLIPDGLVYSLFILTLFFLVLFPSPQFYKHLLISFGASTFLLLIHQATRGRGMGLGDTKLALFGGLFLGWPATLTWLFLSFLTGAGVGVALIVAKRAQWGKPIAFGPFLVISFFITLIWGSSAVSLLI